VAEDQFDSVPIIGIKRDNITFTMDQNED